MAFSVVSKENKQEGTCNPLMIRLDYFFLHKQACAKTTFAELDSQINLSEA